MIINFAVPVPSMHGDKEYWSSFNRGQAELILYGGHGEYPLPEPKKAGSRQLTIETIDGYDIEDGEPAPQWFKDNIEQLKANGRNWYEEAENWGQTIRLTGDVGRMWELFYQLAMSLDPAYDPAGYTPGGDDDTYDYWPSAFRLLCEFGRDLQGLTDQLPVQWCKDNEQAVKALIYPKDRCHMIYASLVTRLHPATLPDEVLSDAWDTIKAAYDN